jgi:hypothetical protein
MKAKFAISCLLLLAAEVSASFLVWSGTPTDWIGEPLHFWRFEISRLQYWALFFSLSALLWIIGWYGLHRRVPGVAMGLLGAVLAVVVEALTSIWYWRQLPWNQASYLGWSYFPRYFREHLISWAVVLLVGLALWFLWNKRPGARPVALS